jgi:hypothetical protein
VNHGTIEVMTIVGLTQIDVSKPNDVGMAKEHAAVNGQEEC